MDDHQGTIGTLTAASTSYSSSEVIRKAARTGRIRIHGQSSEVIDQATRKALWQVWPDPHEYTSQRFVQEWARERAKTRRQEMTDTLPDSYKTLGVQTQTLRAITVKDARIGRLLIQHRTGHGPFEGHRIRFDLEGIPKCLKDNAIMTNTHYLTCGLHQEGSCLEYFSVKRLKKFRKQAKAKGISQYEAIHRWHMTRGARRFVEFAEKTHYWNSVGWIEEEEFPFLEPVTPEEPN